MSNADRLQPATAKSPRHELLDLIPKLAPMPWEDKTQYDALRAAVIAELAPSTPHQHAVAQRLCEAHWEQYRTQVLLRDVSLSTYRKTTIDLLTEGDMSTLPDPDMVALAENLISDDQTKRAKALVGLADYDLTEEDIRAKAYLDHMRAVETLEGSATRQDDRRRALQKEFQALKAAAQRDAIQDAEEL